MSGKAWSWVTGTILALWSIFTLLASNSPEDVQTRASSWANLPIVRSIPSALFSFVSHPLVLALTFTVAGFWIGWRFHSFWSSRRPNAASELGREMAELAYEIRYAAGESRLHSLNAQIGVLRTKAVKMGLNFPMGDSGKPMNTILPYLDQVSTYLLNDQFANAKEAAAHFSK